MISLSIGLVLCVLSLFVTSGAIAWGARKAGSSRARLTVALALVLLMLVLNAAFLFLNTQTVTITAGPLSLIATVILALVQLLLVYSLLKRVFALSSKAALVPFGTYFAITVVQLVVAMYVVRPLLIEGFRMPAGSMAPTLEPGDRFLVNKLILPNRWDLVAYWQEDPQRIILCKRLVGLPGERLRFEAGNLLVNDQPLDMPAVLAGKCRTSVGPMPERYSEGENIQLGADEYFFIGDDPDRSMDSRISGPSSASSFVGVVDLMYWPPRKARIVR